MPPKRKSYTDQQMTDALEAVKDGMSQHNAVQTFNVPRSTLSDEYLVSVTQGNSYLFVMMYL